MVEFNYQNLFKISGQDLLHNKLTKHLKQNGYKNIIENDMFVYAKGNIPIMLVAHVDTVFKNKPEQVFYDSEQKVVTSPQGLGADDRAGIMGIISLINQGYKPYVLFTDGEESGGIGASQATQALQPTKEEIKYIIQLDRRGSDDACFYGCPNQDFKDFILEFDFKEGAGTFSDISTLCPAWDIAGVNFSVGYYNEHHKNEFLKINELEYTIERIKKLFNNIPIEGFEYGELQRTKTYYDKFFTQRKNYKRTKIFKNKENKENTDNKNEQIDDIQHTNTNKSLQEPFEDELQEIYENGYIKDDKFYDGIVMEIRPAMLSLVYGGNEEKWSQFLHEHEIEIRDKIEEIAIDYIFDTYNLNDIIYY